METSEQSNLEKDRSEDVNRLGGVALLSITENPAQNWTPDQGDFFFDHCNDVAFGD